MASRTLQLNDVVEVKSYMQNANQIGINVWHYYVSAVGSLGPNDHDVAVLCEGIFRPYYQQMTTGDTQILGFSAQVVNAVPKFAIQLFPNTLQFGTVSGHTLPRQVCGLIKLTTVNAGRAYRGRKYIAFPPLSANGTDDFPTPTYLGWLDDIGANFANVQTVTNTGHTVTITPCIYNRKTSHVTPINGFLSRVKWATQRRRGDQGRGDVSPF